MLRGRGGGVVVAVVCQVEEVDHADEDVGLGVRKGDFAVAGLLGTASVSFAGGMKSGGGRSREGSGLHLERAVADVAEELGLHAEHDAVHLPGARPAVDDEVVVSPGCHGPENGQRGVAGGEVATPTPQDRS